MGSKREDSDGSVRYKLSRGSSDVTVCVDEGEFDGFHWSAFARKSYGDSRFRWWDTPFEQIDAPEEHYISIDLSKYRDAYVSIIHGKFGDAALKRIHLRYDNCSPSHWKNGYGICFYYNFKVKAWPLSAKDKMMLAVEHGVRFDPQHPFAATAALAVASIRDDIALFDDTGIVTLPGYDFFDRTVDTRRGQAHAS